MAIRQTNTRGARQASSSTLRYELIIRRLRLTNYILLVIALFSIAIGVVVVLTQGSRIIYVNRTTSVATTTIQTFNLSGQLITPPLSVADGPVVTQNMSFGNRLTNINAPLNATELAVINSAPNAYFDKAAAMYLNATFTDNVQHPNNNTVGAPVTKITPFMVNGKPSVIYVGSITCLWCGENRWAMALALSRFGNFSQLFNGYSALQDQDLPTLYWAPAHYNNSTVDLGSFYSSKYINFIAIEDTDPISGPFDVQPIPTIMHEINSTNNVVYEDAFKEVVQSGWNLGTPFTIWGKSVVAEADAVDFGNHYPTNGTLPLQHMTHAQVLQQLQNPNDTFAWTEYAAADLYTAMICATINNAAPVCSLPSIQKIETVNKY